jgi:hypothetical protein
MILKRKTLKRESRQREKMAESKAHRNARLRAMRQKYGLGEFKRSASRKIKKTTRRVYKMAKRRSFSRSSGGKSMIKDVLAGIGAVSVAQKFGVSPLLGYGGAYLASGLTGAVSAFVYNSNILGSLGGASSSSSTTFYG